MEALQTPKQQDETEELYEQRFKQNALHNCDDEPGSTALPLGPDNRPFGPRYATAGPEIYRPRNLPEYNAVKHGMCANTAVLPGESKADYKKLHARWRREYGNPEEDTILFDLVHSAADAAWEKRRCQRQFEIYLAKFEGSPLVTWSDDDQHCYQLAERYRTAADRKFAREFKMLESYVKSQNAKQDRAEKRRLAEEQAKKREEKAIEAELEVELEEFSKEPSLVVDAKTGEVRTRGGKVLAPAPANWDPSNPDLRVALPYQSSTIRETIRKQIIERRRLEREQQHSDKAA